jgi:hypothetical protein
MLASHKVTAGKYYVNSARDIARKVTETNRDIVMFITYHLDTGKSSGVPSECMKQHFTHWADHEATLIEIASLQNHRMDTL